tara:strand:+ start:711 stop:1271 length:561 start_codon:yes stop_codon:yes gene_type:complete
MTFTATLNNLNKVLASKSDLILLDQSTLDLANWIREATQNRKITTIFGNGGSAADAQHWAAELTCTYKSRQRPPFIASALTTDTSIITACSNDFSFQSVFTRQIEGFGLLNGLAIGLSTSGSSMNVLNALEVAKEFSAKTVLVSGSSASIQSYVDLHVKFNSTETSLIQTLTQMLYHSVCELLEVS